MHERLILLRKALGITQADMAEKIGVSRFAISNYEAGTRNITDRTARQICAAYNVDYIWLTTGQGEMFVNTDDALGGIVDSVMQGDNMLAKSIFKGFAQFSEEDWVKLRDLIDKFLAGAIPAEIMERYMNDAAIQRMEGGLGKDNAAFMYGYALGLGEREKKEKDGDQ